ncbi:MAG: methionyl-tRNA formyltransferase, partial [Chlamydiales bacterium]
RGRAVQTSPLVERAREHDIPTLQPESTRGDDFLETVTKLAPDVLMVASYGEILRTPVLELAPHGALNVHASLLPRWRGASPIQRAILAGDATTGVSVQRIVLALDQGDVLLALETPIDADETSGDLFERLAELGGEAAVASLDRLESGDAKFTPQDEAGVTHAKKLTKADGWIDWSRPAVELERFVRGMHPWPGARTRLPDQRELRVLSSRIDPNPPAALGQATPGTLLPVPDRLCLATGDGALELVQVQPQGKKTMDASAFQRGAHLQPGDLWTAPDAP